MSTMTRKEFEAAIDEMVADAAGNGFEPHADYIPEGDCLEFFAAPDDYYAERIDGYVTVYYSRETQEIIGMLIKGYRAICRKIIAEQATGMQIDVTDRSVSMSHIIKVQMEEVSRPGHLFRSYEKAAEEGEKKHHELYEKMYQMAERSDVKAELCSA